MKILVNTTVCTAGGAVQVATAFVRQVCHDARGHEWGFALSEQVQRNVALLQSGKWPVEVFSPTPSRLFRGKSSRQKLREFETALQPDLVFTVFGPAYCRFQAVHVCGFADGWVTHPSRFALESLPLTTRLRYILRKAYKSQFLRRDDFYIVEAEIGRKGLVHRLGIRDENITVVPNSFADLFVEAWDDVERPRHESDPVQVLCLAYPHAHKNLLLVPKVAAVLKSRGLADHYRFVVTLPNSGCEVRRFWLEVDRLDVPKMIKNAGCILLSDCPKWYFQSDIVFLPTLLETSSATYPEAMKMGRPIVTTDLDFAREACGNAAEFFLPLSAESAADAIQRVTNDEQRRQTLIRKGYERLSRFPGPEAKYQMQVSFLEQVAHRCGIVG